MVRRTAHSIILIYQSLRCPNKKKCSGITISAPVTRHAEKYVFASDGTAVLYSIDRMKMGGRRILFRTLHIFRSVLNFV
jgi:hypothetical protein